MDQRGDEAQCHRHALRLANGTSCATTGGWAQGWIVMSSGGKRQPALPAGLTVLPTAAAHSLTFKLIGLGTTPITLKFCRASPAGNQERVVSSNATGGASVKR